MAATGLAAVPPAVAGAGAGPAIDPNSIDEMNVLTEFARAFSFDATAREVTISLEMAYAVASALHDVIATIETASEPSEIREFALAMQDTLATGPFLAAPGIDGMATDEEFDPYAIDVDFFHSDRFGAGLAMNLEDATEWAFFWRLQGMRLRTSIIAQWHEVADALSAFVAQLEEAADNLSAVRADLTAALNAAADDESSISVHSDDETVRIADPLETQLNRLRELVDIDARAIARLRQETELLRRDRQRQRARIDELQERVLALERAQTAHSSSSLPSAGTKRAVSTPSPLSCVDCGCVMRPSTTCECLCHVVAAGID